MERPPPPAGASASSMLAPHARRCPSRSIRSPISERATRTKSCCGGQPVGEAPEGLAQRALDPVAVDGAADLAADRHAEPHVVRPPRPCGGSCRERGSGSHVMCRRGRRGRTRRCARGGGVVATPSRSQALPAFAAPALEDRPAAAGAHPRPESVRLRPLPLLRLVGPLHRASQYTDAVPSGANVAGIFPRDLRRRAWFAPAGRRYGRPPVHDDRPTTGPRRPLAGRPGRLRASVPRFDLPSSGWSRSRSSEPRRDDAPPLGPGRASAPGPSGATPA